MMDRMLRALLILLAAAALSFVGCSDDSSSDADAATDEDEEELPDVDCDGGIPTYGEVAAFNTCVNCHSSEVTGSARQDAPEEDNFDTYEGVEGKAEEIAHEVFEGEMPPEDSGLSLTGDEKDELYRWALCGAPE